MEDAKPGQGKASAKRGADFRRHRYRVAASGRSGGRRVGKGERFSPLLNSAEVPWAANAMIHVHTAYASTKRQLTKPLGKAEIWQTATSHDTSHCGCFSSRSSGQDAQVFTSAYIELKPNVQCRSQSPYIAFIIVTRPANPARSSWGIACKSFSKQHAQPNARTSSGSTHLD